MCGQTKDVLQSRSEEMCVADFRLFQRPVLCTWRVVLLLGLYFLGFSRLFDSTIENFLGFFQKQLEINSGS